MRGLVPVQSLSQVWALSQKSCICSLLALLIAFCYSPCSRKNKQLCLPQPLPSSRRQRGSPPGDPLWPRGVPSSAVALPSQLSSLIATLLLLINHPIPHPPRPVLWWSSKVLDPALHTGCWLPAIPTRLLLPALYDVQRGTPSASLSGATSALRRRLQVWFGDLAYLPIICIRSLPSHP